MGDAPLSDDPTIAFLQVVDGAHHATLGWLTQGIDLIMAVEDNGGLTPEILVGWYSAIRENSDLAVNLLVGLVGQE